MTIFQWILRTVLTLVLLIALAILIAPKLIDPNDYRDTITEIVKDKTGRELIIGGDLSVSVFPWLGVKTQGLSISQPEGIDGFLLAVESAQVRVKFIPLLSKRIEIDTITLNKPELSLVTLKNGINSFSGLSDTNDTNDQEINESNAAIALVIQGLELTDGTLIWEDQNAGQHYRVNKLNVVSGNLIGDKLAQLNVDGVFNDILTGDQLSFSIAALMRLDTNSMSVFAQQFNSKISVGADLFNLEFESMLLDQLATLQVDNASIKTNLGRREFVFLLSEIALNLDSEHLELSPIQIRSADLNGTIKNLKVKQLISAPSISGDLEIQPFDANTLINDLDIDYTPAKQASLSKVALKSKFIGSVDEIELQNLDVFIDQSKLSGSFKARNLENLKVEFDLTLDELNLDDYLPEEQNNSASADESVSSAAALLIPMAALKDIYANGTFRANQLISGGLELNEIDVLIESTPGNLTITPKASLYDGTLDGRMVFSEQGDESSLDIKNEIDLVSLAKFLTAADVSEQLSGIGSLTLDIKVVEKEGVQSNHGSIKLLAKEGAIKGFDLKKILDQGLVQYNKYRDQESEEEEEGNESADGVQDDETRFAELKGTFLLNNFLITNDDFEMKAPLFRVSGSGEIDLVTETINYLVKVSIVNSTSGQGGEALDKLRGLTIPIRFEGSLVAPSYSIDMKALYKGLARKEIEQKKSEYLQEKLGIEGGGQLSTKEILEKLLIEKISEPDVELESASIESGDSTAHEEPKSEKDQLKEDLVKKLLEELFK